jgi:hypothetical protein
MQPSHAELARTLTAGRLPATASVACRPGLFPVRHLADADGHLLLLTPAGGGLAGALRPADGGDDTAVVLDIPDVPPVAGAPSLGRVWVAGWARALDGDEARAAALGWAEQDPTGDLLDVGHGQVLHHVDVAEIRLERNDVTVDVDPEDFAVAAPDPLHRLEFDLIADLADHHGTEITDHLRRRLGPAAGRDTPHVVRLDRYGFVVRLGERLARLPFPRPVADRADLGRLLHPVLCPRCSHRPAAPAA